MQQFVVAIAHDQTFGQPRPSEMSCWEYLALVSATLLRAHRIGMAAPIENIDCSNCGINVHATSTLVVEHAGFECRWSS